MTDSARCRSADFAALLQEAPARAFAEAQAAARADPDDAPAIRAMAAALRCLGEADRAVAADDAAVAASLRAPDMRTAGTALAEGRVALAERHVRAHLRHDPADPAGNRLLADLAARAGRFEEAERLLRCALAVTPAYRGAAAELAILLHKNDRLDEALATVDTLLGYRADDPAALELKATLLVHGGRYDDAIAIGDALLDRFPSEPKLWLSRASRLRAIGRADEARGAIRKALALAPTSGDAWWALADLKTARFDAADVAAMEQAMASDALPARDRMLIGFALGKAHEDHDAYRAAFDQYRAANALRRASVPYNAAATTALVDRSLALPSPISTEEFSPGPIFVIGMHRAGSTLVEQILASHGSIEGIAELPHVRRLADRLAREGDYPALLMDLAPERLAALGAEYRARTAAHRHGAERFFIDKMPGNWRHLPLILRMLPNAPIIDVRRHPLDCCWSNFRQFFADGQDYSYDLAELGRYYRDYVRMTAGIDAAMPGRVHRVFYEALVADPEREIRRLTEYLGVDFDPACLRFHETERAVRTPSAEQVRRPIDARGIGQAQPFALWLGPLKQALGDVLDCYPAVPPAFAPPGISR